jgi:hypothetical protein
MKVGDVIACPEGMVYDMGCEATITAVFGSMRTSIRVWADCPIHGEVEQEFEPWEVDA